ncbi:hypothetical protein [Hydrogenophaga sp.]|uniref:hypothetical protein n=1 Tax=Hydrogenophaga sp. TaxID=1904254 RepID=UPI00260F72A0|nr:hypothetical protein [Hydrogenophaga sp.]MCW5654279.1 hypothetical protein [Hydrogenophaga sp.]
MHRNAGAPQALARLEVFPSYVAVAQVDHKRQQPWWARGMGAGLVPIQLGGHQVAMVRRAQGRGHHGVQILW